MARALVRLDGLTEAKAAVEALPQAFRETIAQTFEVGAAIIEGEADARVPVAKGTMKASLGTRLREDGLQATVGYGDPKARFVEFSTVDTPAQPSLWPAFRIGARFVRKMMRTWGEEAGERVRFKVKRGKREPKKVTP